MARQDFTTLERGLKECYLPAWDNQIGITPSPFISAIKKETLTGGKHIYAAAEVGLSGGFGFGSEASNNAPDAGNQRIDGFVIPIRDMYTTIEISDKAIRLSQGESLVNAFDTEMKAGYAAAEWNVGRSAFGDGSGKLATFTGENTVDDVSKLKEGLIVDIYSNEGVKGERVRIRGIDRIGKKLSLAGEGGAVSASSGFLTVQGSYNLELTGLAALLNPEGTIYELDKSDPDYYYLKPTIEACGSAGVTDMDIDRVLRIAEREKNSKVNMLLCGDEAYEQYVAYLRETNQRTDSSVILEGGFKALKYSHGSVDINIVNEQFVPSDEIWGVDTDKFTFKKTEWDFVTKDGSAFERISGSSNLQALLACYGNIVCTNPGGCVKLTGCKA